MEVLDLWQKVDVICFDVDSILCPDKGVDELAEICRSGKIVAEWTARTSFKRGTQGLEPPCATKLSQAYYCCGLYSNQGLGPEPT
uniref:Phosphoserine phosphatase, chloroplastic n=1 Tax=Tanacetum cinerariifolium TaxID=118510 RepID=A0A699HFU4_TANCI|nr:phosphoserine phosphatase, chloroplastic [Tanacetum cinerariifolium]